MFSDPQIWNWDETAVCGEYGHETKCVGSSRNNQGGARWEIKDPGEQLTAGIAMSASENVAPLLHIAPGKKVMKSWRTPLEPTDFTEKNGVKH